MWRGSLRVFHPFKWNSLMHLTWITGKYPECHCRESETGPSWGSWTCFGALKRISSATILHKSTVVVWQCTHWTFHTCCYSINTQWWICTGKHRGAALPMNTPGVPCIFDPQGRAGICGDWLTGSSIEAAVLSGMSLGDHVSCAIICFSQYTEYHMFCVVQPYKFSRFDARLLVQIY